MDRTGHGGERRLGDATALRQAVVREAAPVLLGSGGIVQDFWSERGGGAAAERGFCAAGDAWPRVACVARLWRGLRALALAAAADDRGHDRIFTRRGHGYAVFGNGGAGDGGSGVCSRACARGTPRARPSRLGTGGGPAERVSWKNAANRRTAGLRIFSWTRRAGKRPGWDHPLRRWRVLLGAPDEALARRISAAASSSNSGVLRDGAPLVSPLRPPQSGLLPCLHHRAQLQALLDARISAHSAVVVLRPDSADRIEIGR